MLKSFSWDQYFMTMAYLVSMKSKDPSTRMGAVIVSEDNAVISTGYNGLPRGLDDHLHRYSDKEYKYLSIIHAEESAILHCARFGVSAKGSRIYSPWMPCSRCAKAIIQSGITEVIYDENFPGNFEANQTSEWKRSLLISSEILAEAKVSLRKFNFDLIKIQGLYQGKTFELL
jgi:dCMP deaminase